MLIIFGVYFGALILVIIFSYIVLYKASKNNIISKQILDHFDYTWEDACKDYLSESTDDSCEDYLTKMIKEAQDHKYEI